jgi:hypothetical protein
MQRHQASPSTPALARPSDPTETRAAAAAATTTAAADSSASATTAPSRRHHGAVATEAAATARGGSAGVHLLLLAEAVEVPVRGSNILRQRREVPVRDLVVRAPLERERERERERESRYVTYVTLLTAHYCSRHAATPPRRR